MNYYVYILFSERRKRFYVGQTQNVEIRIESHNKGQVKSTKSGFPWKVVTTFEFTSRSEAMSVEHKIKKRGIKRFLEDSQFGV